MKLLFIADIVGAAGLSAVKKNLPMLISEFSPDVTVANGENINKGNGITPDEAQELHFCGADVITLGNHAFRQTKVYDFLDDCPYIFRPANYPASAHGRGWGEFRSADGRRVGVINLLGQIDLEPVDNPFYAFDKAFKALDGCDFVFVDFHAEATSEKKAFGYYADGRANAVFGTHTHVQTADEQIFPKGTAYISDAGMTGAFESVLGVKKELSLAMFLTRERVPFEQADGEMMINGVFYDSETKTITRINRKG